MAVRQQPAREMGRGTPQASENNAPFSTADIPAAKPQPFCPVRQSIVTGWHWGRQSVTVRSSGWERPGPGRHQGSCDAVAAGQIAPQLQRPIVPARADAHRLSDRPLTVAPTAIETGLLSGWIGTWCGIQLQKPPRPLGLCQPNMGETSKRPIHSGHRGIWFVPSEDGSNTPCVLPCIQVSNASRESSGSRTQHRSACATVVNPTERACSRVCDRTTSREK